MSELQTVTVFGWVIAMFGPICVAIASERSVEPKKRLEPHLFAQAALVAIAAAVLSIVFLVENNPVSSIGLRPLTLQSVTSGLALAAFFMYVFSPLARWMLRYCCLGGFDKGLAKLQRFPAWYLILTVTAGGVAEEILYRGYAVERMATLTGSLWLAGAIPVVVFAVAHVPMWGWGPALAALVSGGIITVFYLWQRDLVACIVAHVVTDFAGIVIGSVVDSKWAS